MRSPDPEIGNRVHSPEGSFPIGSLPERIPSLHTPDLPPPPLALLCTRAEEAIGAAAWASRTGTDIVILPEHRLTPHVRSLLLESGYALVHLGTGASELPATARDARPGQVGILTSGTTGPPKLVAHSWDTLRTLRTDRGSRLRWLLVYESGTYAWFQVVTMALFLDGQDLVVPASADPEEVLLFGTATGADAISSTPTFWRILLFREPPERIARLPLRQITLGGERVDQALLDRLRALFPAARLTHIYASSEVGASIVVSDGREGFPKAWLESEGGPEPAASREQGAPTTPRTGEPSPARPRLLVREDRLLVASPYAALGAAGFVDTGDLVEFRGDRVVVVGRAGETIINVGGLKVSAVEVEQALLEHEQVAWCRVYPRTAPLVGQIVAADVVLRIPEAGEDARQAERALSAHLHGRVREAAIPRLWKFLEAIPVTEALKSPVGGTS